MFELPRSSSPREWSPFTTRLVAVMGLCACTTAPGEDRILAGADRGANLPPVVGTEDASVGIPTGGSSGGGDGGSTGGTSGGGGSRPCVPGPAEVCGNNLDDTCDGLVDEGCVCMGPEKGCYAGRPSDLEQANTACRAGVQYCELEFYGPCEGQILPGDEVCDGLDNDCDGAVDDLPNCDNIPPQAICPPDQAGSTLANYTLEGGYMDADGDAMQSAEWRLVGKPAGSTAVPMPPNALRTETFADLQGEYVFELTVTDARGGIGKCQTRINAGSDDELRVEMVWNTGAANDHSDVDMHLLRDPNARWFDEAPDGGDCFFANCRVCRAPYDLGDDAVEVECREEISRFNNDPNLDPPPQIAWFPPLDTDDPRLDLDDVQGLGPENINIRSPRDGTYRLGVHYWHDDGFGRSSVSVRVFCGGELAMSFEPVTLDNRGADPGGAETAFWEVGDIVWQGDGCRVQPFGEVGNRRVCTTGELMLNNRCP